MATTTTDGRGSMTQELASRPAIRGFEASVDSSASPDAIFALLVDPAAHFEWGGRRYGGKGEYLVALDAPPGPAAVGTTWASEGHAHEGTYHDRSTVTIVEPPKRFEFVTEAAFQRGTSTTRYPIRHSYTIAPTASGARITHREEFLGRATGGSWLGRLMMSSALAPIAATMGRSLLKGGLDNLARMAEEGASARA
jgi:uncharacterized protein YndB with AHSA1/START domain